VTSARRSIVTDHTPMTTERVPYVDPLVPANAATRLVRRAFDIGPIGRFMIWIASDLDPFWHWWTRVAASVMALCLGCCPQGQSSYIEMDEPAEPTLKQPNETPNRV
jgi:hypothetical protein